MPAEERDSKTTLPLAIKVSTLENPRVEKRSRSASILTTRPPTLMARRKAMYRVMATLLLLSSYVPRTYGGNEAAARGGGRGRRHGTAGATAREGKLSARERIDLLLDEGTFE